MEYYGIHRNLIYIVIAAKEGEGWHMLIESGYWNYYLAFRIESFQKHLQEMEKKQTNSGLVAYISDGERLQKKELEKYEKDHMLASALKDSINDVAFISSAYHKMAGSFGKERCGYYVLMPLVVYFSETEFAYCQVYMQLFTNGSGMIKIQIPLKNVKSENLSHYPLPRWFAKVKVWHELYEEGGEKEYQFLSFDTKGVIDITHVMQKYVQNFFSESIVDDKRFLGFETFVISESSGCDISKLQDDDIEGIKQVYRFVYPENFAIHPSENEIREFWKNSRFNASGIYVICGDQARMVLYTDVDKMLERNGREKNISKNEYLNNSISATFDLYIMLALAQKDNEMTIYSLSERDRHTVNDRMVHYYANANYLDSMLFTVPKHGKIFYNHVRNMLDHCMVDFDEMIHRIQSIEEYEKTRLTEKQNNSINRFTLIFTVLFGLPLIQETLSMLKDVFHIQTDVVPVLDITQISFLIWFILLFALLSETVERSLEYERISVNDNSFVLSKIKKFILFVWLKLR